MKYKIVKMKNEQEILELESDNPAIEIKAAICWLVWWMAAWDITDKTKWKFLANFLNDSDSLQELIWITNVEDLFNSEFILINLTTNNIE